MEKASQTETKKVPRQRKRYLKPSIEQVSLALEEAVLGTGCKTTESAGPTDPCVINFTNCTADGS